MEHPRLREAQIDDGLLDLDDEGRRNKPASIDSVLHEIGFTESMGRAWLDDIEGGDFTAL